LTSDILVAVDLSDAAKAILGRASKYVGAFSSKLWPVHVAEPGPGFLERDPATQLMRDEMAVT